jgi:aromatic ring-opening dioxygenase catalytic subunit (LigB family)
MALPPVHFFSHGSTMMLGEESRSADYWKACGDEALRHGIKGVIMMGAHWDVSFLLSCRDYDAREKRQ